MEGLFDTYWRWLGLPLSRMKGRLFDPLPFSVVEVSVWAAFSVLLLGGLLALRRGPGRFRRPRFLLLTGLAFLLLLAANQGAFPFALAPTAWRKPLAQSLAPPRLPEEKFQALARERVNRLHRDFEPSWYARLEEREMLVLCDRELDRLLQALRLPPGRTVAAVKPMGPLTTLLGLTYGGPAFHDPLFAEAALVPTEDMPSTRSWRLLAVCHEAAHAKGFTREMDAEILTQGALEGSADRRLRTLAALHFLRKTGLPFPLPEFLREEARAKAAERRELEKKQRALAFLKKGARRLGLQNSDGKYGTRKKGERWREDHPFFATVAALGSSSPLPPARGRGKATP